MTECLPSVTGIELPASLSGLEMFSANRQSSSSPTGSAGGNSSTNSNQAIQQLEDDLLNLANDDSDEHRLLQLSPSTHDPLEGDAGCDGAKDQELDTTAAADEAAERHNKQQNAIKPVSDLIAKDSEDVMAEQAAAKSVDDLLEGSLEETECSEEEGVCGVCRQPYTQPPRVLRCLHVFCEACLSKQQRPLSSSPSKSSQSTKGVICCPKCHTETECIHGVKSLPLDYVLINRLDMEAIQKRTVICTSCKSEENAIARCQDCSSFLCPNCKQAHSSMLCFENHLVVPFEAFDEDQAQIHRPVICPRHPREVSQLYDPACGMALCNECLVAGHQGHGCKKVSEFDFQERNYLTTLLLEAREKLECFDQINDSLTSSLSELQTTRDSVRSAIEESYITFKNILDQARADAMTELESLHTSQEMRVMDDIQLCQESRVNLEHSIEFGDKLSKYGDAAEFLSLKMLVTTRISKLMHSCPKAGDHRELKFVSDRAKFAASVKNLFGEIVDCCADEVGDDDVRQTSTSRSHAGMLSSSSVVPDISNTSAARLLPSELLADAVSASSQLSSSSSVIFNNSTIDQRHSMLTAPSQIPPPTDVTAPESHDLSELRTVLAQLNLARFAGDSTDVSANSVLHQLVNDVTDHHHPGRGGMGPTPDLHHHLRTGGASSIVKPNGPPTVDEENHLMNNMSALAKLACQLPYAPLGGHMAPPAGPASSSSASSVLRGCGPLTPPLGAVDGGVSMPSPPMSVSGQRSPPGSSGSRDNRPTAMQIRTKFGQLGSSQSQFSSPHGFCLGLNEEIVVADTNNHRIQIFDKEGNCKSEFGLQGKEEGQLWYPRKVAVMKNSGTYVVCDRGNERSRMQLFTKNGEFMKKIAIRYIDIVAGLALTSDGRIVAVDSVSPTVFVIAETGDLLLWFDCSEHMREPSDIAVWGSEFYICDFKGHCVVVYSDCGNFLRRIGGEGITNFPNGIDISDHGDVLVGDSHGNRFHIVVFNRQGDRISEFECPYCKVSRCCGLKITSEGYVVTLAKNNHHVLILNTLYIS